MSGSREIYRATCQVIGVFVCLGMAVANGQAAPNSDAPASVELLSSVKLVVPGEAFDVAIAFQLGEGWHIYWQNPGDSGQAPQVSWTLPDGFIAGDLQFPIPKRHHSAGDLVTNIHEGKPVLLATITPPDRINGAKVTLSAKLRYLICNATCLIRHADLEVTLPVSDRDVETIPAQEDLFRRAKRALPETRSKYLSIRGSTTPDQPRPGQSFDLTVEVNIKRGYHIQSHTPSNPAFIKADLYLNRTEGLYFEESLYPPPKLRKVKYLGQLSEYAGKIRIRVRGVVEEDAEGVSFPIAGLFKYQACNEKGTCFAPAAIAFALDTRQADAGSSSESPVVAITQGVPTKPADDTPDSIIENPSSANQTPSESPAHQATTASDEGFDIQAFLEKLGIPGQLLICFLYGLFINATPCVLPLLSIKVMSFVQQAHESRSRTLALGLAFGAGVVVFFVALGLLATQGGNVLQYPVAVIALGSIVTALALSMLGVFTLQVPTSATKLDAAIQKEGVFSSMGKGALAPVLGFACTAPLMVGAMAWATSQTQEMAILAFFVMGLGMASPYMLLGAFPHWLSFLPRPGNWMITFERVMGFLLLGFVVLLIHPLVSHLGSEGLEWTLVFLVIVGMACWLLGKVSYTMPSSTRWGYRGASAGLVVCSALVIFGWIFPIGAAMESGNSGGPIKNHYVDWQRWSAEAVEQAVHSGKTVLVDVTAAYCTNCKVNKKVALEREATAAKLKELGVVAFQADFTKGDPIIFEELKKFGRAGPPLDVIYPAGNFDNPIVLDTLFSQQTLLNKLDQAGPSKSATTARINQ